MIHNLVLLYFIKSGLLIGVSRLILSYSLLNRYRTVNKDVKYVYQFM